MSNSATENVAVEFVMGLERAAGREPADVRRTDAGFDISSPPRKIEVKAFGGSARGAQIPLEQRQVDAANEDPANFYLYVVDQVARADLGEMAVHVVYGEALRRMIDSSKPQITYWPTFRVADYDATERLGQPHHEE